MLIHAKHAVRVRNFRKVAVTSPETNVFVMFYHFMHWIHAYLEQLCMISGKKERQNRVQIHVLREILHDIITEIFQLFMH